MDQDGAEPSVLTHMGISDEVLPIQRSCHPAKPIGVADPECPRGTGLATACRPYFRVDECRPLCRHRVAGTYSLLRWLSAMHKQNRGLELWWILRTYYGRSETAWITAISPCHICGSCFEQRAAVPVEQIWMPFSMASTHFQITTRSCLAQCLSNLTTLDEAASSPAVNSATQVGVFASNATPLLQIM